MRESESEGGNEGTRERGREGERERGRGRGKAEEGVSVAQGVSSNKAFCFVV